MPEPVAVTIEPPSIADVPETVRLPRAWVPPTAPPNTALPVTPSVRRLLVPLVLLLLSVLVKVMLASVPLSLAMRVVLLPITTAPA